MKKIYLIFFMAFVSYSATAQEMHRITLSLAKPSCEVLSTITAENIKEKISVFPNPVKSSLNIKSDFDGAQYELLDMTGKVVSAGVLVRGITKLWTVDFPIGLYVLHVYAGTETDTIKILLQ